MIPFESLRILAHEVSLVDACLTAATCGRGVDGNGQVLPDLDAHVRQALERLVQAGAFAGGLLRQDALPTDPC